MGRLVVVLAALTICTAACASDSDLATGGPEPTTGLDDPTSLDSGDTATTTAEPASGVVCATERLGHLRIAGEDDLTISGDGWSMVIADTAAGIQIVLEVRGAPRGSFSFDPVRWRDDGIWTQQGFGELLEDSASTIYVGVGERGQATLLTLDGASYGFRSMRFPQWPTLNFFVGAVPPAYATRPPDDPDSHRRLSFGGTEESTCGVRQE